MLYFQQMSRAMALTCTGEVFILMDNYKTGFVQSGPWPSIWLTHELPVLRALFRQGIVTKLTAIQLSDQARIDRTKDLKVSTTRDIDIDWNEPIARAVKAKKLEWLRNGPDNNATDGHKARLQRRIDNCETASDNEGPRQDWFG
jgi:hypothetical protein